MAMTKTERLAKKEIYETLKDEGYLKYAEIFKKVDLNITEDPGIVAFFEPSKGRIVVNIGLDIEQISVIIRHEILHYFLEHERRLIDKLSKEKKMDSPDDISLNDIKRELYGNSDFNIAGDYEISNVAYTDEDKVQVRSIKLNGQTLSGLVTEDDHPEWANWSLEDMYDELRKIRKKDLEQAQQNIKDNQVIEGAFADPITFVGSDGTVYGI